jgi:hypothetical protein
MSPMILGYLTAIASYPVVVSRTRLADQGWVRYLAARRSVIER